MTPVKRVADATGIFRNALWGLFALTAVLNILALTGPLYMLQVYDRVMASGSVPTLLVITALMLVLYATNGLLDLLRTRALTRASLGVHARLSGPVLRANLRLPLAMGQRAANAAPERDMDAVRRFLGSPAPASILDVPFTPLYFALLFLFHPLLGALSLAGGAVIFVLVVVNEFSSRQPARDLASASGAQARITQGARRNAEVIAAMGMGGRIGSRAADLLGGFTLAQGRSSDRSALFSTTIKTLRMVLQSAMLGLGAYLALRQQISPGMMIASSILMSRALSPIEQAVGQWPVLVAARQGAERLDKVLAQTEKDDGMPGMPLPRAALRVEALVAAAPGEQRPLLQGIDFALKAGDALGIVGPSGSGKTSLLRAMVGVWPALRGAVRFDGGTLDQWTEDDRGRIVGYLPQDVELFDGTVAENIARFDTDPDMNAVVEAATLAGIHEMVGALPGGYGTRIGEGGARLSAGQRQRIGLARALFARPFLIALDEPNSNLDAEGEKALAEAIIRMRQAGSIVVVVAHRTNVLATVNKLLRVQGGQQVAFGDRDEVAAAAVQPLVQPLRPKEVPHAV
ncbi:type I secretion system permease/ATPase [Cereibacter sp. SYSU M97828]|nr:type I secretion system permease/ATPase [Cereibacter flavus]